MISEAYVGMMIDAEEIPGDEVSDEYWCWDLGPKDHDCVRWKGHQGMHFDVWNNWSQADPHRPAIKIPTGKVVVSMAWDSTDTIEFLKKGLGRTD